jgi:pyrimidine operon attenuation protein/uracil phosphoribosyltransferase
MRDMDDQLLDERHAALMNSLKGIHERLDNLNGRTRQIEIDHAVLADRAKRSATISWSSIGAVVAGALYWMVTAMRK